MFRNAQSLRKLIETAKGSRDVVDSTREMDAAAPLLREPFRPWNHARTETFANLSLGDLSEGARMSAAEHQPIPGCLMSMSEISIALQDQAG